jgi:hypothetical protein
MDTQTVTDIRSRAREVARDLLLERNDAPVSDEQLLAIMYIRAFSDGVLAAGSSAQVQPRFFVSVHADGRHV